MTASPSSYPHRLIKGVAQELGSRGAIPRLSPSLLRHAVWVCHFRICTVGVNSCQRPLNREAGHLLPRAHAHLSGVFSPPPTAALQCTNPAP